MNYTTTSTPFVKGLATLGMLLTAGAMTSFANINVTKTLADVELQAPGSLKAQSEAVTVNGTGTVTFKMSFAVDNGCCMRVQAQMMRQIAALPNRLGPPLPGLPTPVGVPKTFELCGNLNDQSLTLPVDSNTDNANFFVVFTNPDSWDKAHVTISVKAVFPLPLFILSVHDGNLPLTIQAGDVNDTRTFTITPADSTGKANLTMSWTNNTQLSVTITRPDGTLVPNPAGGTAFKSDAGKTNLSIQNIAVTAANSAAGNVWTVTVTNLSSVASTGITMGLSYTANE